MKILYNAHIYTLDGSHPVATAIAMEGDRILAVGNAEVLLTEFDRGEKQDMAGGIILPGLTDAHLHLQHYALSLQKINCETDTMEECMLRVEERVHSAQPGEWILGHGWNQNNWFSSSPRGRGAGDEGASWPSATDLDKIAPNNPVYLTAKSLHAAWANSAALKRAGITASTPDPANGQLRRDEHGSLTGILLETAMGLLSSAIPEPSIEAIAKAIEEAQPLLWRLISTSAPK